MAGVFGSQRVTTPTLLIISSESGPYNAEIKQSDVMCVAVGDVLIKNGRSLWGNPNRHGFLLLLV